MRKLRLHKKWRDVLYFAIAFSIKVWGYVGLQILFFSKGQYVLPVPQPIDIIFQVVSIACGLLSVFLFSRVVEWQKSEEAQPKD